MRAGFGERVAAAASALPRGARPRAAVVLGSGLSGIADRLGGFEVPYSSIPEFPKPSVEGHRGVLRLSDRAAVMAGRFHFYEGLSLDAIVLPVFVLREIGVETLILTNAAGAVNRDYAPGDLVLIKDHINFMGASAFVGPNPTRPDGTAFGGPAGAPVPEGAGLRFFDMSEVYSAELRALARAAAAERLGLELREGAYMAFSGPAYETPAEIGMARAMGADLVGMSTVPEATAARFLGMRVLGVSLVTNMAAGVERAGGAGAARLSHAEVVAEGARAEAKLESLIIDLIDRL